MSNTTRGLFGMGTVVSSEIGPRFRPCSSADATPTVNTTASPTRTINQLVAKRFFPAITQSPVVSGDSHVCVGERADDFLGPADQRNGAALRERGRRRAGGE